ncbi:MAG: TatD family hydrolase [Candidatus Poseidoniaceae archaeon]|nr:TatD family hydrolase [Candidatus Poseidoniaceae archaeon]
MNATAMWDGPIVDNHFHLNRNGLFLQAAGEFKKAGGTDLILVHCPDFSGPPTTREGHLTTYQDTVKMASEVRTEHDLGVRVVLGPHPAAFAHQFQAWLEEDGEHGAERAMTNYRDSIDAALELIHQGVAHAVGEVGRPHWPVSDRVWDLSNVLLEETMAMARRENVTLQLHVEGELESTYSDLAAMADRVGFDKQRLVRHYAPPTITGSITQGLTPSVLIGKGAIEEVLATAESSTHGFLLETDYMDDVRRPGAVLGPKTVPKRTQQLMAAGLDEAFLWKAHQELPDLLYGAIDR